MIKLFIALTLIGLAVVYGLFGAAYGIAKLLKKNKINIEKFLQKVLTNMANSSNI